MAGRTRGREREDFQVAVTCALALEHDAVVFAFEEILEQGCRLDRKPKRYASPFWYEKAKHVKCNSHSLV
ncbi:hypothetical protein CCHL11_00762 [Colletotrichum chlorophyti]|uniref:Uncharacterized protein n=1 Tax=Colletotrichum chlorophyti TaxID=708187 RepID=A0A1Q8S5I6_9PEZI|nr:hypothetical protein CCHL11_00762 [Colletotrichum chlorophyti]